MSATINCIICGGKATCSGGHVHKGDEKVIANFCSQHFKNKGKIINRRNCKGCYGEWKESMGEDTSFGQVDFIDSNNP